MSCSRAGIEPVSLYRSQSSSREVPCLTCPPPVARLEEEAREEERLGIRLWGDFVGMPRTAYPLKRGCTSAWWPDWRVRADPARSGCRLLPRADAWRRNAGACADSPFDPPGRPARTCPTVPEHREGPSASGDD